MYKTRRYDWLKKTEKKNKKTEHLTLDKTGTGQWKQTNQCVTEKKNTDGHQKTRYKKNIKCSDNTHLPPKKTTRQPQHHRQIRVKQRRNIGRSKI